MTITVLLVDDDARLPELLKGFLEPQGVTVTTVASGTAALDALGRQTFDVVVLDVMMPGMDGLEVRRRIRSKSNVPVLMLTTRGDETDRIVGLELGADDGSRRRRANWPTPAGACARSSAMARPSMSFYESSPRSEPISSC